MDNTDLWRYAEHLQALAIKHQLTVATAESCTGGMIASTITSIAGASEYFYGGIVSYSNAAKIGLLRVSKKTLEEYGAVSRQIALEMAQGCMKVSNADIAVSVTGIAGPGGATATKDAGLVYIGIATAKTIEIQKHVFQGNRQEVREQSVASALRGLSTAAELLALPI